MGENNLEPVGQKHCHPRLQPRGLRNPSKQILRHQSSKRHRKSFRNDDPLTGSDTAESPSPSPQGSGRQGFYSHIFLVRKPSGKYWLILNLKILNKSIQYKHFWMDTIHSVTKLLFPGCFMVSFLDLRDAYLHVPIAQSSDIFPACSQLGKISVASSIQGSTLRAVILPQSIHQIDGRSTVTAEGGYLSCLTWMTC